MNADYGCESHTVSLTRGLSEDRPQPVCYNVRRRSSRKLLAGVGPADGKREVGE
jgi:hypothetical protein